MKELCEILDAYETIKQQGKTAALATVVAVSGSSYRRPGARMLMAADGWLAGGVSGGCLESDVLQRARVIMESGQPDIVTYDTTEDGDIVFGVGLGCRGVIQILIEPLTGDRPDFEFLTSLARRREAGVCATVFRSEGGARNMHCPPVQSPSSSKRLPPRSRSSSSGRAMTRRPLSGWRRSWAGTSPSPTRAPPMRL